MDQLVQVSNPRSTTNYTSFDVTGRVTASNQVTNGQTYPFSNYTYNLAGALTKETYPSGRVVTTTYDAANRPSGVSGVLSGATTNYLSGVTYLPHGAAKSFTRGNTLASSWYYNSRLQPVESYEALNGNTNQLLALSCFDWGTQAVSACAGSFSASADNGTLKHKVDYAGGPAAFGSLTSYGHTYSYDNLNRLTGDSDSGGASRTMGYDQWGNMATTGGVIWSGLTPTSVSGFNASNRLSYSSFNYDNAGNMTLLRSIGISYDAENHQVSTNDSTLHVQVSYGYDGAGNRVLKNVASGATTVYVYDALGLKAAEYISSSHAVPCTTCYLSYDHLGSVRLVTNQSRAVVARHDYVPFGEEIPGGSYGRGSQFGASDGLLQRFTGQDRDSENTPSLDYFNARYMSSVLGRFASVDPGNAGADLMNPQSWNGYAYGLNNPLRFVDPSGRACVYVGGTGGDYTDPDNYEDDDNGGQSCDEAFGGSTPVSANSDTDITQVPTFSETQSFLQYWLNGSLPSSINYGPNDGMTKQSASSFTFDVVRQRYISNGCQSGNFDSGHFLPYFEAYVAPLLTPEAPLLSDEGVEPSGAQPPNFALAQVGGFNTRASISGNVTTFTITNRASNSSFLAGTTFGFSIQDNPNGPTGPRYNVTQTFTFSESNVCSH